MKANSLREAIVAALPDFATDPDRLCMWITSGRITGTLTDSRGFGWAYKLHITLENFTGHPAVLFLAINDWLRVYQPDLLQTGPHTGYVHEADILDDSTVDMMVTLDLSETMAVTTLPDGSDQITPVDETAFALSDSLLDDDAPMPTLRNVTLIQTATP